MSAIRPSSPRLDSPSAAVETEVELHGSARLDPDRGDGWQFDARLRTPFDQGDTVVAVALVARGLLR